MNDDPQLRRLFDLGADQDDCVSASQLVGAGFTYDTIDSLVDRGVLTRVLHGVYVIGARALSDRQFKWCALLAAGPGSALSHFTAAAMHGLLDPDPSEVWVTTPGRRGERTIKTKVPVAAINAPGTVRIISSRPGRLTVLLDGQHVLAPAGALVGLAAKGAPEWVVRAWREADYRSQLRSEDMDYETGPGIVGSALIGEIGRAFPIVSDAETLVDTKAEYALLEAVLQLGLPRPRTNRPLQLPGATYLPDQHYPDVGLVVEADGGVHRRPDRQAADRARDQHMRRHGLTVLRFWNEEIETDVLACAREVALQHEELLLVNPDGGVTVRAATQAGATTADRIP